MPYPWGLSGVSEAVFTPAAASHVAGDVHGGRQNFPNFGARGARVEIMSASLLIAGGTIETTAWALHLFNALPTAILDDAAFDIPAAADQAIYIGSIALAQVVDLGGVLYIETNNIGKLVRINDPAAVYGFLVNGTTLTPQAVAHTVRVGWVAR